MSSSLIRMLALVLPAFLLLAGCSDVQTIDAEVPAEGHRLAIIPLRDATHYHYDSPRGILLAQELTDALVLKRKALGEDEVLEVVPFEELSSAIGRIRKNPKDISFPDVGRMVAANLVLVGTIERFETRIPGDVGMARGRASVDVKIIEVERPEKPFYKRRVDVTFPRESRGNTGVLEPSEVDERTVSDGLMRVLVEDLTKLFYTHDEQIRRW